MRDSYTIFQQYFKHTTHFKPNIKTYNLHPFIQHTVPIQEASKLKQKLFWTKRNEGRGHLDLNWFNYKTNLQQTKLR